MKTLHAIFLCFLLLTGVQFAYTQDDEPESPLVKLQPLTEAWNAAISTGKVEKLLPLYADAVDCYGKTSKKEDVIASKKAWLAKHPSYQQEVSAFFLRESFGLYEVAFEKVLIENGKRQTVVGYLLFDPETNLIVGESDRSTDKVLAKRAIAIAPPQGETCYEVAGDIWPPIAEPTRYETVYKLKIEGSKISGEGSRYSWAMRTMYLLRIKGTVLPDNKLSLSIIMEGPMYEDDPNDKLEIKEVRKWDGKQLVWDSGDEPEYLRLEPVDCE